MPYVFRWNNRSEYNNIYELQAKVWVAELNGKYADLGRTWVTIYEDKKNERQITYSLTDASNLTTAHDFPNTTDGVHYRFRYKHLTVYKHIAVISLQM